jgi:hypothetical protein
VYPGTSIPPDNHTKNTLSASKEDVTVPKNPTTRMIEIGRWEKENKLSVK